ncbi:CG14926 [Drosophila busckii]|uniref:CG14926 n=1 Tax=Drosophila busckii TaxID=30019 RepID=A0A0M4EAC2_DROBS|nr:glycine-rich cell wall structural protein 1.8 [Drosophila busckii]ALC39314.1 CG14926 [Drosophila busckii]
MAYGGNGGHAGGGGGMAEFGWDYMGGGGGAPNMYPQMGQVNPSSFGGGQQWLHSNQNHGGNYASSMPQGQASPAPFEDYNQSMMRQFAMPKSEGKANMYNMQGAQQDNSMGMSPMGGFGGYPSSMSRNGLGTPGAGGGMGGGMGAGMGAGMGGAANSGYSSSW